MKTSKLKASNNSGNCSDARFKSWLGQMPPGIAVRQDFTFKLNVTMRTELWMYLSMGASVNHISLDDAVSYCLDSGIEVCDWANDDFAMVVEDFAELGVRRNPLCRQPGLEPPNHGPENRQPLHSSQACADQRIPKPTPRTGLASEAGRA